MSDIIVIVDRLRIPSILLLAIAVPAAFAVDTDARVEALEGRLLAPCCWSEPVAVHRSEIALQMKLEIRQMVDAGRSDREILDAYIARYGQRVLVEPEGTAATWIHVVPVVAVILGLLAVILVIRRLAYGDKPGEHAATPKTHPAA